MSAWRELPVSEADGDSALQHAALEFFWPDGRGSDTAQSTPAMPNDMVLL